MPDNNNRRIEQKFGRGLEKFELAKLRRRYEALGYEFRTFFRGENAGTLEADAHAINPKTGDEIVFEIKSATNYNRRTAIHVKQQRVRLSESFPKARFILVLAREQEELTFDFPVLADLLLGYITTHNNLLNYPYFVDRLRRVHGITDLECTALNITFDGLILLSGSGNLRLWLHVEDEEFEGNALHDGIPFYYSVMVRYSGQSHILENCDIRFDLSEFE